MGGCSAPGYINSTTNGFRMFGIPKRPDRQVIRIQYLRREDWKKTLPKDYSNCQV